MPKKTTPLERGNIYFFYTPRVKVDKAQGFEDVQRLYIVLSPTGKRLYRLMVVPKKKLPSIAEPSRTYFSYVDKVVKDPLQLRPEMQEESYQTKTRGSQTDPAFRPAGEGVYVIAQHDGHTHLAYALELPAKLGEVQKMLNLEEEGNLLISVINPDKPSPPDVGLPEEDEAKYPAELKKAFGDRRFLTLGPVELLDYPGAQILLIAAYAAELKDLDLELNPQEETATTAEIFNDLRLQKSQHPTEPLFEGKWA